MQVAKKNNLISASVILLHISMHRKRESYCAAKLQNSNSGTDTILCVARTHNMGLGVIGAGH